MKDLCPACGHDHTYLKYDTTTKVCNNCGYTWATLTINDSTVLLVGPEATPSKPKPEPEVKVKDCFPFEQFANRVTYTPPGQNFTIPTQTFQLPFINCEICGAAVNAEPRPMQMHADWHSLWGVRP